MRIRIVQARQDEVDGVELGALEVGLTYEVSPYLGTYLVATGSAEAATPHEPALVTPLRGVRVEWAPRNGAQSLRT